MDEIDNNKTSGMINIMRIAFGAVVHFVSNDKSIY